MQKLPKKEKEEKEEKLKNEKTKNAVLNKIMWINANEMKLPNISKHSTLDAIRQTLEKTIKENNFT